MSSKLLPCFLLAFDRVTRSEEKRSAYSVNWPDPIDKRMGTEEWLDSFVPILLSKRASRLRDSASGGNGGQADTGGKPEAVLVWR